MLQMSCYYVKIINILDYNILENVGKFIWETRRKKENGKRAKFKAGKKTQFKSKPTEVIVLSDDHASGKKGQYFNFDVDTFNRVFVFDDGWKTRQGPRANVMRGNKMIHKNKQLRLWTFPNGGSKGMDMGSYDLGRVRVIFKRGIYLYQHHTNA